MFNHKIASLEARIARLEAHLSRKASVKKAMYSPEEEYMMELKNYLDEEFEELDITFKLVGLTMTGIFRDLMGTTISISFGNPFLKIVVTADYGQKYLKKISNGESFEDIKEAVLSCIGEVQG